MEITRTETKIIGPSDHRWGQVTFASKVNFRLDEKSEVKRSHTGLKILRKDAEKRVSAPWSRSSSSRMTEYLIGPDEYLSPRERDRHGGQCGKWQTIWQYSNRLINFADIYKIALWTGMGSSILQVAFNLT